MKYLEAPEAYSSNATDGPRLFLAGGITGCADWQSQVVAQLQDLPIVVCNPRRKNFPIHDPAAAAEQIRWEHTWLHAAEAILFWFSPETLNPIVLFEYGRYGFNGAASIFVGCDPSYARMQDVKIQTALEFPGRVVHSSLESLVQEVRAHFQFYLFSIHTVVSRLQSEDRFGDFRIELDGYDDEAVPAGKPAKQFVESVGELDEFGVLEICLAKLQAAFGARLTDLTTDGDHNSCEAIFACDGDWYVLRVK